MTLSVIFIDAEGIEREVEAREGWSLMEIATTQMVPGIEADCGGACACATCHVYVEPAWLGKLPPRTESEVEMLEFAADLQDNSRLSCQIKFVPELNGLTVTTPENQF